MLPCLMTKSCWTNTIDISCYTQQRRELSSNIANACFAHVFLPDGHITVPKFTKNVHLKAILHNNIASVATLKESLYV